MLYLWMHCLLLLIKARFLCHDKTFLSLMVGQLFFRAHSVITTQRVISRKGNKTVQGQTGMGGGGGH